MESGRDTLLVDRGPGAGVGPGSVLHCGAVVPESLPALGGALPSAVSAGFVKRALPGLPRDELSPAYGKLSENIYCLLYLRTIIRDLVFEEVFCEHMIYEMQGEFCICKYAEKSVPRGALI